MHFAKRLSTKTKLMRQCERQVKGEERERKREKEGEGELEG